MRDETRRNPCVSSDGTWKCTYCSPKDVMQALRLVDYGDDFAEGIHEPSDADVVSYDELVFRICCAEEEVDVRTGTSWRENRVVNQVLTVPKYWHDENTLRSDYWYHGGYFLQLEKDVCDWDPWEGDKLEFRTPSGNWVEPPIAFCHPPSGAQPRWIPEIDEDGDPRFWMDNKAGRMFVRMPWLFNGADKVRITYRYGKVKDSLPAMVARVTALMVAVTYLNDDLFCSKLPNGGDVSGLIQNTSKAYREEIDRVILMLRRVPAVTSLLRG